MTSLTFAVRSRYHKTWFALLLSAAPVMAQTPPARFVREKVLPKAGQTEKLQTPFPLSPLAKTVGKVFTQAYTRTGATEYRLHFKVAGAVSDGAAEIRVVPVGGGASWSWKPTAAQQEIWSGVVPNNSTVEVWSAVANNALQAAVDSIIVVSPPTVQKAITPPDSRKPITADYLQWGKSVGRIRFVAEDGGQYLCTGFLVAADLIMTNQHCMKTQAEAATAEVDFDYRQGAARVVATVKELIFADVDLDFALHRLTKASGREPLKLADSPFQEGQTLLIIQHPAGEPQQISEQDCKVNGISIAGVSTATTDFGHLCDTLGGSSGSPVIDMNTKTVVGIHHLGFVPTSDKFVNQGVRMGQIMALIRAKHPEIVLP